MAKVASQATFMYTGLTEEVKAGSSWEKVSWIAIGLPPFKGVFYISCPIYNSGHMAWTDQTEILPLTHPTPPRSCGYHSQQTRRDDLFSTSLAPSNRFGQKRLCTLKSTRNIDRKTLACYSTLQSVKPLD